MSYSKKVASKFNYLIVLSVAIPVILSSIGITLYMFQRFGHEVYEKDRLHARGLTERVKFFVDRAFDLNFQLSINPQIIDMVENAASDWDLRTDNYNQTFDTSDGLRSGSGPALLVELQRRYLFPELFFIQDAQGYQTARSFGPLGFRGKRWWFLRFVADRNFRPFMSKSYYSMTGDKPVASAFHPIFKNDDFIGIMGLDINFEHLQNMVNQYLETSDLEAIVLDNKGVVIAHPDREVVRGAYNLKDMTRNVLIKGADGQALQSKGGYHQTKIETIDMDVAVAKIVNRAVSGQNGFMADVTLDGASCDIHYNAVPLPGTGSSGNYVLLLIRNNASLIAAKRLILLFTSLFTGIALLIIIMLFRLHFNRVILTPLSVLTRSMQDSQIDADINLTIDTGDEFQLLADTYSEMRAQIKGQNEKLTNLNRDLEQRVVERTKDLEAAYRQLETAKNAAESANEAKGQFLANMSHEIRTPMNAIIGMTYLCMRHETVPAQKDYLDKILSASQALLRIINDILDFSKIEAGKMDLEHVEFQLDNVLDNLSDVAGPIACEKEVELIFKPAAGIPANLLGDPLRLGQILLNLVNNAIKFTEKGEVTVTISLADQNDRQVKLLFSIQDSGIGLTDDQKSKLFEAFSQADTSTTRQYGGTGLGLVISKNLVELMNGEITVDSTVRKGSTFRFTAWFEKGAGPAQTQAPYNIQTIRILVVDDNATIREIVEAMLIDWGCRVTLASSGKQALDLVSSADKKNESFDIVIVDWMMPEMDGIETSRRIKEDRTLGRTPKIILMTAHGGEPVMRYSRKSDPDGHLYKPISRMVLEDTILGVLGWKLTSATSVDTEAKGNTVDERFPCEARILVVEDNDVNQLVARELLTDAGFEVTIANNGAEAVAITQKNPFDAILMDVQMPMMDGYTATAEIRRWEEAKRKELGKEKDKGQKARGMGQEVKDEKAIHSSSPEPFAHRPTPIPIIAMTAHALKGEREKCLAAGMDDFVAKPIEPEKLFKVLSKWIVPGKRPLNTKPSERKEDSTLDFGRLTTIDTATGLARVSGNPKVYYEVLSRFFAGYPRNMEAIFKGLEAKDIEQVQYLVHTLKGMSANIGANETAKAAAELEQELKALNKTEDLTAIKKCCQRLEARMKYVIRELTDMGVAKGDVLDKRRETTERSLPVNAEIISPLLSELEELLTTDLVLAGEHMTKLKEHLENSIYAEPFIELETALKKFDIDSAQRCLHQIMAML